MPVSTIVTVLALELARTGGKAEGGIDKLTLAAPRAECGEPSGVNCVQSPAGLNLYVTPSASRRPCFGVSKDWRKG
jgi:hypothetical protein